MNVIELCGVNKSYQGRELYRGVDASVPEGAITAVIGPNGSGKSVLFKLMTGLLKPDAGEVRVAPEFMSAKRSFPEHFGIIIDRPGYLAHRTGLDNLRQLARIRNRITDREIIESMYSVGLDPSIKQKVRAYSLGMKQKLALAQAIMEHPRVLVLDEPFNALDQEAVQLLRAMLADFRARGNTVVFTSHDPNDVQALADRTLVIDRGLITTEERPKQARPPIG